MPVLGGARAGGTLQAVSKPCAYWWSLNSLHKVKITLASRSHVPTAGLEDTKGKCPPSPISCPSPPPAPVPDPSPADDVAFQQHRCCKGVVVPGEQGHSAGPSWAGWEADPAHWVSAIAPGLQEITRQTPLPGCCMPWSCRAVLCQLTPDLPLEVWSVHLEQAHTL